MPDSTMSEQTDLMEQVWSSIDELISGLGPGDWDAPTDCPGWSVRDQLGHMAGNESGLLGRPLPEAEAPARAYIRNEMGARNEAQVEARRGIPVADVVAEWREVTGERLRLMRGWSAEEWDASTWAPPGEMPRRDALRFRIFDAWVHEQDMRRATDRPGHMSGGVARFVLQMMMPVMAWVVGKKVGPEDGTTVLFDVSGGPGATPFAVKMHGGRGELADPPEAPTATLSMDFQAFACLACGRWSPDRAVADGRLTLLGDAALARRVADNMNYVP